MSVFKLCPTQECQCLNCARLGYVSVPSVHQSGMSVYCCLLCSWNELLLNWAVDVGDVQSCERGLYVRDVQSCERGLHSSSCHGICALLKTCDMCTLYSGEQSSVTSSTVSHTWNTTSGLPVTGHCVWCVKEAVCYRHDGMSLAVVDQLCSVWCSLVACWHRRRRQDKTVLSCVCGVNTVGNKTRQFCLVLTQFPICNCSVSNILRITENLEIGNWVKTIQTSSKLGRDETKLSATAIT